MRCGDAVTFGCRTDWWTYDFQFHVVLRGGALDAQQHRVCAQRDEADGDRVLLGVRLVARRERVLDHALVEAELVGHRFCQNQTNYRVIKAPKPSTYTVKPVLSENWTQRVFNVKVI